MVGGAHGQTFRRKGDAFDIFVEMARAAGCENVGMRDIVGKVGIYDYIFVKCLEKEIILSMATHML